MGLFNLIQEIKERQSEGIQLAKLHGVYKGRVKENNFKIIDSKAIKTIIDKGINIPLPTKISFSVVSNDSILVSTNYYSSTTKNVFLNNISKSYLFKETPSASKITITNDGSINKKQLKVVYQFKNEKLANGILLESTSYTKEEVKDILKK